MIAEAESGEIKKWWTARELAGLKLPGFPHSKQKINRMAKKECWPSREREASGGGREYEFATLPPDLRLASVRKLSAPLTEAAPKPEAAPSDKENPPQAKTHEELWKLFYQRPEKEQEFAKRRMEALVRISDYEEGGINRTQAVETVAKEMDISKASLYSWNSMIAGRERFDWLPSLLGKWKGGQRKVEFSPEAWEIFKGDYLRLEQPAAAACYERLERIAEKKGLIIPSLKMILKMVSKLPPEVVVLARKGKEALDRLYPSQIRDKSGLHALQCVNADCFKIDNLIPGNKRLYCASFQDVYSGKLLSYRVDKTENREVVRLAFADMVEQYGIPEHIYFDNGRAFASKWLTGGVENRCRFKIKPEDPRGIMVSLGCKIHWTTPYHGQSKPVERAFRDLAEYICKHPALAGSYTGKDPVSKPENYGSEPVDPDVLMKVFQKEFIAHNARPERRSPVCDGRSKDETFFESYEKSVIRKATESQKGMLLLAAEGARVSNGGGMITIAKNVYQNDALIRYGSQNVIARIDPQNYHRGIFVYTLENQFICAAECRHAVGFMDENQAKEVARARARRRKAAKAMLESERTIDASQVAAMLPKTEKAEPEIQSPKVIEGMFGIHLDAPRQADDKRADDFTRIIDDMGKAGLEKMARRMGVAQKKTVIQY